MFYVYVLFNKEVAKTYIGQTNNLEVRLIEHSLKQGNHYTARFSGKWKLIYKEEFYSRKEAIIREKQLKSSRGREFIRKIIPL